VSAPAGLDPASIQERIQSEVQRAIQRSIKGVEPPPGPRSVRRRKKHDIVVLGHNVAQVRAQVEAYGLPGAVQR